MIKIFGDYNFVTKDLWCQLKYCVQCEISLCDHLATITTFFLRFKLVRRLLKILHFRVFSFLLFDCGSICSCF